MDPVIVGKLLLLTDFGGSSNVPHKVLHYEDLLDSGEHAAKKSAGELQHRSSPFPKKTQLAVMKSTLL